MHLAGTLLGCLCPSEVPTCSLQDRALVWVYGGEDVSVTKPYLRSATGRREGGRVFMHQKNTLSLYAFSCALCFAVYNSLDDFVLTRPFL